VSNSWQTATTATQQLAVFTHGAVGALPAVRVAHVPHLAWQQGSRVGGGGGCGEHTQAHSGSTQL
jgi:hypothetical protein